MKTAPGWRESSALFDRLQEIHKPHAATDSMPCLTCELVTLLAFAHGTILNMRGLGAAPKDDGAPYYDMVARTTQRWTK